MRLIKENVERIAEDPAVIASLKDKGYKPLKNTKEDDEVAGSAPTDDLAAMKVEELRKLASDRNIAGAGSLSKKELLEALKDVV